MTTINTQKLEEYIKESENILSTFLNERELSLNNKQIFSFAINSAVLISYYLSGKFSKKDLLEDNYKIQPEELPPIFDKLPGEVKGINNTDYNKQIIDHELHILNSFVNYKDMMFALLNLHCKYACNTDRYEIIDKMSRISGYNLDDINVCSDPKLSFLSEAGLSPTPFNVDSYSLSEEKWKQVYSVPDLVFYMISAADGKISKKEKKQFEKFILDDLNNKNPLISHIFSKSKEIFDNKPQEFEVGKQEEVFTELKEAVAIMSQKFSSYEMDEISILLIKLAYEVAAASGFGGFGFVDYKESQSINEISVLLDLSEYENKIVKYSDKVLIGVKRVQYPQFFRMIYARDIVNVINN